MRLLAAFSLIVAASLLLALIATSQEAERVHPITAPSTPLPSEAESNGVRQYSFIAYGDTRGRRDGVAIQYEHSLVIDSMLKQIERMKTTPFPVRFVLQSGDAVVNGREVRQWNVSFVPLINRLTTEGGVPYFLVPGNHEATTSPDGLRNYLDAVSALIPPEGSPRRLAGFTTFAFGYGNTFVLGLDANIAGDDKQFAWVKSQLEGLDRTRYLNVLIFCHQAPFSSGPHGGAKVEPATAALRERYMPLFHLHHVRAVFSGHEHLFEHWVEHYTDTTGTHRMDLVVSGGGGAPLYPYTGEPDLEAYLKTNQPLKASLEHLVKPGNQDVPTPYHYVIVRVVGEKLDLQVVGVDWGRNFAPYRSSEVDLQDQPTH
jgi:3',5'-cyclic AMP phosphodiesterase CpdA